MNRLSEIDQVHAVNSKGHATGTTIACVGDDAAPTLPMERRPVGGEKGAGFGQSVDIRSARRTEVKMKVFARWLFLYGLLVLTNQDIGSGRNCDCRKCAKVASPNAFLPEPMTGGKAVDESKSGCNICSHRKEMLRLEKERLRKLQKCPFEILGSPSLKGKTSEEIFDEFREIIVPSQNGFFDLMRGIVRTMHVSSESELQWAKAKQAKMEAENQKNRQKGPKTN